MRVHQPYAPQLAALPCCQSVQRRFTGSFQRRQHAFVTSRIPAVAQGSSSATASQNGQLKADRSHDTEVVVIGSGIGGLSAAAMLAMYGEAVTVVESHDIPGGCAHAWKQDGFHFESGPSLYSGMASRGRAANPLAHVLQAIEEPLELLEYNTWNVIIPEGEFLTEVGTSQMEQVVQRISGESGVKEWRRLQEVMKPLSAAASTTPAVAIRLDAGAALTFLLRYLPQLATSGLDSLKLLRPFSEVLDKECTPGSFVHNYMNLLSFLLSGLPANGTIAAEVAFMFQEWFKPGACLEFPKGGSQAMVAALVRGVKKRAGGRVLLKAHVEEILYEGGRAAGVRLRDGSIIRASKAVISNCSAWDTVKLLPAKAVPAAYLKSIQQMPINRSFMHLHLGFDATGLPPGLEMHHICVNSWSSADGGVDSKQNVVLISIPSIIDPDLAPAGYHTLHAYLPATEPFALWKDLERGSDEYKLLKEERSQVLWKAVERIIPDIRDRCKGLPVMVGTPLTHAHFVRRHAGTYGPGIRAGEGQFPFQKTPIDGLLCCGDCTFPGIGLPAVAASGAIAASTLVSPAKHWAMLDRIGA